MSPLRIGRTKPLRIGFCIPEVLLFCFFFHRILTLIALSTSPPIVTSTKTNSRPTPFFLYRQDKYVLGSMVILVIVCIWHCMVTFDVIRQSSASGAGLEPGQKDTPQYWALKGFSIAYVGFHLAFGFWLYYDVSMGEEMGEQ